MYPKTMIKFVLTLCGSLLLVMGLNAQDDREITEVYPELNLPIAQQRSLTQESTVEITAECSLLKPRTGLVTINWKEQQRSFAEYRLDLTTRKGGFDNELFATVWPIRYGNESKLINRKRYPSEDLTRGLKLSTSAVNPSRNSSPSTVTLEGLEPGINYFWRVLRRDESGWTTSEVIRIEAPTCPVDLQKN